MLRRTFFRLSLDNRENIIRIFTEMADLNNALGEKYKVQSYNRAVRSLKTHLDLPLRTVEDLEKFPGIGSKLLKKAEEIIRTGKLDELEKKTKPKLKAIQELTQIHGFGPRAAATLFDREGIFTVEDLIEKADQIQLTEQQRVGVRYFHDINEKIPMHESILHENFLRECALRRLGSDYEIQICGSYRRRHPFSGDIDAILARSLNAPPLDAPVTTTGVLTILVEYLQEQRYLEATMALGPLKYMGMGRLPPRTTGGATKTYKARRVDIRLIETKSVPTALLTFTGSKNFNVIMRQAAISKGYLLNEYGLFKVGTSDEVRVLQERVRARKAAGLSKSQMKQEDPYSSSSVTEEGAEPFVSSISGNSAKMETLGMTKEELEAKRVHVTCEKDVFDVLGMPYAKPENRDP
ncbi:mitochondrial DNA polymerase beta [Trypanosoma equiperdum]|uniref:DNA polymerase n=5 Tax=Trypanozoon TaxID=39700 RepID=D6XGL4_TRYB2|nr:mitochondrial DNA polymerase beta [Trypanosoma brucei gambiense DAL972]XP_844950.1 mitochondrial DNA polymerase beta [Trypanosoma brucei brucei TREU927]AAQ56191.1 DNA polymerase beta [Trypanosoma brucei]RHW72479.1 mitochondrial DNA polymerase beta [Trypanosoma brucei equiperdum]SCU64737.1 mitochondrial DNA polymerase beta [Trypanosoma equiperdum]AAX79362.1 mitochondrial DNA polymerase beta [Trypanosoma brucei]AAZ11391.1 mitochondrial DNA polymerase beta [Trypanosoma brucei brucei TREU927]|eukprot:XP_011773541.1 mitochondrial DNA polymerase beta [Trypanosoma brucei gambiense DAL972]